MMSKKSPQLRFEGFTDDWEERKLGDMMDVTSVKRIHQSDWTNSGIRFLRARDIVSAAKNEEPSDYLYISEEKYNEYSKISGKVSQGDLLVTGVGSIGVPLLITDDNPIYFKDGNIIWFKNEHKIDGNFFYYSFINNKIQKYIRDVAGIGTVGTYTIDSGKKTPISLPTYDEQIKIGSFFKQLDDTIALHQHKLDLLKEQKKGFLQKMFPKNGAKVPELRFEGFADDWEQRKLGEMLEDKTILEQSDGNHGELYPKSSEFAKEGIPYLAASNIIDNNIDYQNVKYLPLLRAEQFKKGVARDGDILLAHNATVGPSALLKINLPFVILSTTLTLYRINKDKMDNLFFLSIIRSNKVQNQLKKMMKQTTRNQVPILAQRTIDIFYPKNLKEQAKVGEFFKQLDDTITLHQLKLDLLKEQKKGFLQKMFA